MTGWTYQQIGELDLWQLRSIGQQLQIEAQQAELESRIREIMRKPDLSEEDKRAAIAFLREEAGSS